ncbi:MAG: hypothetical protein HW402_343 [Dehalococcoidales bacterium]|nr:hypothetical protein [Dehalococcoidales bacterium]
MPLSYTYQVSHNSLYAFNNCHSSLRWNPGAGWYLDSGLRQNDIFYLNSITHALSPSYNETISNFPFHREGGQGDRHSTEARQ